MSDVFKDWLTPDQAAALTGYNAEYCRQLARAGKVQSHKMGHALLLNRTDLLRYKAEMDALGEQKYTPSAYKGEGDQAASRPRRTHCELCGERLFPDGACQNPECRNFDNPDC